MPGHRTRDAFADVLPASRGPAPKQIGFCEQVAHAAELNDVTSFSRMMMIGIEITTLEEKVITLDT